MSRASLVLVFLVALAQIALGQGSPSVTPHPSGSSVPTWVFYWVLGLGSAVGGVLCLIIKILWVKTSVLSEEERTWLRETHAIRSEVPKAWTDLFDEIEDNLKRSEATLQQLVTHVAGDKADLQAQLRERLELHDRQQAKMLKLAVRVQRAVEALAGLRTPEIESDLDDASDDEGR